MDARAEKGQTSLGSGNQILLKQGFISNKKSNNIFIMKQISRGRSLQIMAYLYLQKFSSSSLILMVNHGRKCYHFHFTERRVSFCLQQYCPSRKNGYVYSGYQKQVYQNNFVLRCYCKQVLLKKKAKNWRKRIFLSIEHFSLIPLYGYLIFKILVFGFFFQSKVLFYFKDLLQISEIFKY